MATFEVSDELMEITGSTELRKRMRFWFVQEIAEEEGLLKYLCDRCDDLRRKSVRRCVLIREMEALGECGVAVDSLDCLKQTHARETAKLAGLTNVMAETLAGIHEKEGHDFKDVDDIEFRYVWFLEKMAVTNEIDGRKSSGTNGAMEMLRERTIVPFVGRATWPG
ncbi:hypothetical protein Tco_1204133 [Tanacetum coccineum]